MNNTSVFAEAHRLEEEGKSFALAFIIESRGSTPRESGRMIVRSDGTTLGTIGGGPVEAEVIEEAQTAISEGNSRTLRRGMNDSSEDVSTMDCEGGLVVRIEVTAAPRLLLIGGGHINLAIAQAAIPLGFAIEVVENRREFCHPERFPMARALYVQEDLKEALIEAKIDKNTFVVVAPSGDEMRLLPILLASDLAYLGMLGSRKKAHKIISTLSLSPSNNHRLFTLHSPIGLEIGAKTPAEIAISVLAEILQTRYTRAAFSSKGISKNLILLRGGGDLATGVAWRLHRCGFKVVILEIEKPTVIRRTVAFATALFEETSTVEGIKAQKALNISEAYEILQSGAIPVLIDPDASSVDIFHPFAIVDAILAKKNLGTTASMAPLVIALGPGFSAGKDCHAVVETVRGHALGTVLLSGEAQENTGKPGVIAGKSEERVLRAPILGYFKGKARIGDLIKKGDLIAEIIADPASSSPIKTPIKASFDGKLRGLIADGISVKKGEKIADIDPRGAPIDEKKISDKARAVAGGVLEALMVLQHKN